MTLTDADERRFWLAVVAVGMVLLAGCGGEERSLIDGEWEYELVGAECSNGQPPTGTMVIYEGAQGELSGQYDICGKVIARADLGGRVRGQRFELVMPAVGVGVVSGWASIDVLKGTVVGLGEGKSFEALRAGKGGGKSQGPP